MRKVILLSSISIFILSLVSASSLLSDGSDGTVSDSGTNLMWQKCSHGMRYESGGCSETAALLNWYEALEYCENLELAGHSDWRLPAVSELKTIVNYSHAKGEAATYTVFPKTESFYYWTSTTTAEESDKAWLVDFATGYVAYPDHLPKLEKKVFLRCVRSAGK